jgi:hypothetical protein
MRRAKASHEIGNFENAILVRFIRRPLSERIKKGRHFVSVYHLRFVSAKKRNDIIQRLN